MNTLKQHFLILLFFAASLTTFAQVGIGTTSPEGVLDVVSSDSGIILSRVVNTTAVTSPVNGMLIYDIANTCTKTYQNGAWSGCLTTPTSIIDADADTQIQVEEAADDDSIRFDTAGTERVVINNTGNVGIGISTPNAPLQLAATTANRKVVLFEATNNAHEFYGLGINPGVQRYQVAATTADHVFYSAADATSSNELMRIEGTGNIGIGTATPTDRLHVAGDARITGALKDSNNEAGTLGQVLSATAAGTDWINTSTLAVNSIQDADTDTQIQVEEAADDDTIRFDTAGTERVVINNTGNVGIGTSTPNAPLQLASTAGNRKVVLYEATNNAHEFYGFGINSGVQRYQVANSTANHVFYSAADATSSNELMRIEGTGNVGIGASNPQTDLHIGSSSNTVSDPGQIILSRYWASATDVRASAIFHYIEEPGGAGDGLAFASSGDGGGHRNAPNQLSEADMVIRSNGNVGIGTTTPTERLHVIGNILASGTITPDYVFEKYYEGESSLKSDYTMQTLSEIEAFTREHKHLPGVPSAQDVEEKGGIVLNRATEINLEKIEELYLHTIEQQKQIEILQTQVKLLLESKE